MNDGGPSSRTEGRRCDRGLPTVVPCRQTGSGPSTECRTARSRLPLGADDVVAVTRLAEHLLRLPIFYLEYSGTYGSPQVLRSVRRVLSATRLWYGGGIRMPEQVS